MYELCCGSVCPIKCCGEAPSRRCGRVKKPPCCGDDVTDRLAIAVSGQDSAWEVDACAASNAGTRRAKACGAPTVLQGGALQLVSREG